MSSPVEQEVQRFRTAIRRQLGLNFDDTRLGFLADVLERRTDATRGAREAYLQALELSCREDERRGLAKELTVPESYFFRHVDQLNAFAEVTLPARLEVRASARQLSVLSAGCAGGEEPYSLAILLRERVPKGWEVGLEALDLNAIMLEKARRGRYSSWALRETPIAVQERWFTRDGRDYVLDPSLRAAVRFREGNLVNEALTPARYDVIFCRNVLMYFAPEVMRDVIGRFARALAPGGYLFLGHAETLRGISHDFHLCHSHSTFYYQRKAELAHASAAPAVRDVAAPMVASLQEDWALSWVETVQHAAARIKALTEPQPSAPDPDRDVHDRPTLQLVHAGPVFDLSIALELLKQERFQEALAQLAALPRESFDEPDVVLLRAVLLTHCGELGAAQRTCAELLVRDELNAGAHYLLALCREGQGDSAAAFDHDQVAVYLDPTFAMPRLHLGLMARRARDHDAARLELSHALQLLQGEDSARLLLFGGGFGRSALLALCQAEIAAAGRA